MKTSVKAYALRNLRELLRDPLNFAFALGFPLVVLLLLNMISANVPEAIFPLETLAPGIAVFGLSFISLFCGMLIAKDRSTSLLMRLFSSPMTAGDFLAAYVLPLFPIAFVQCVICVAASVCLGLPLTARVLLLPIVLLPAMLLYVALGLLAGVLVTDKQVGSVCGALLTNLTAWLSGAWFEISLVGGAFEKIAYCLPFAHAVDAGKAVLAGSTAALWPHIVWVTAYAILAFTAAVWVFHKKMKNASM